MKGNQHKKATFQYNFVKKWCCSAVNHPEGWAWWKRKARRDYRRKTKKELKNLSNF